MINTIVKSLAVVFIAGFIGKCAGDRFDVPVNQKDPGAPLVAGIPIDGKAYPAPFVCEDGNIQLDCFQISFQNVDGYEVINLRFDGILNPLIPENEDDDIFNDEYMRFFGTESPCQNIYLTIDGMPKAFSVYNFKDGVGPFIAKGCSCSGGQFIPFFGDQLEGSCQMCRNSFVLSFVNVPELRDGQPHTVKITVLTKNLKIWGEQVYEDVIFEAGDVCPDSGYGRKEVEERLNQVLPEEYRELVEEHMPLYLCGEAPNIEGDFLMSPISTVYDGLGAGYGTLTTPKYIRFCNQDMENNTISYQSYGFSGFLISNELEEDEGVFISGCGNNFTVFFNRTENAGITNNTWNKVAVIISGTMTEEGIQDIYYAFIGIEKDDPTHFFAPLGILKVMKDEDGMSSFTQWPF